MRKHFLDRRSVYNVNFKMIEKDSLEEDLPEKHEELQPYKSFETQGLKKKLLKSSILLQLKRTN